MLLASGAARMYGGGSFGRQTGTKTKGMPIKTQKSERISLILPIRCADIPSEGVYVQLSGLPSWLSICGRNGSKNQTFNKINVVYCTIDVYEDVYASLAGIPASWFMAASIFVPG